MALSSGAAHGKVILLGEHAVVFGAPALVAGLDRGARAEAEPADSSSLSLGGDVILPDSKSSDDRARAFAALLAAGTPAPALAVRASSELPMGGGLGSSAALGVAIARAVAGVFVEEETRDADAMARAEAWERVFHGNPSGIDTAAAARGGVFLYTRAGGIVPCGPARDIPLAIGWSGAGSSTKAMVEGVARMRERKPDLVDRAVVGITSLVRNAALAIDAGDLAGLGRLLDLNQMILAGLLLSTESIETLCSAARGAGALGAKLTGAGGGGSVIALGADRAAAERIVDAWKRAGFDAFVAEVKRG